jgi:hypothetical protein
MEPIDSDATKLIMAIMTQNAKDSAYVTDQLMDGYKSERDLERARVAAIRWQIFRMFDAGVMPSERAIKDAMYPNDELVRDFIEDVQNG